MHTVNPHPDDQPVPVHQPRMQTVSADLEQKACDAGSYRARLRTARAPTACMSFIAARRQPGRCGPKECGISLTKMADSKLATCVTQPA